MPWPTNTSTADRMDDARGLGGLQPLLRPFVARVLLRGHCLAALLGQTALEGDQAAGAARVLGGGAAVLGIESTRALAGIVGDLLEERIRVGLPCLQRERTRDQRGENGWAEAAHDRLPVQASPRRPGHLAIDAVLASFPRRGTNTIGPTSSSADERSTRGAGTSYLRPIRTSPSRIGRRSAPIVSA